MSANALSRYCALSFDYFVSTQGWGKCCQNCSGIAATADGHRRNTLLREGLSSDDLPPELAILHILDCVLNSDLEWLRMDVCAHSRFLNESRRIFIDRG